MDKKDLKYYRKKLRYFFEAVVFYIFLSVIWLLPYRTSSSFCGFLAKKVGPLTSGHRVAKRNLRLIYPKLSESKISSILNSVWDNLGRNIGEFPHISRLTDEHLKKYVKVRFECEIPKNPSRGIFFVSAHYANWEMILRINRLHGIKMHSLQRSLNNSLINKTVVNIRKSAGAYGIIEKGVAGVRQSLGILRSGGFVGGLMDQKLNDGVSCKFLGHDAMTSNLPEKLFNKDLCDIVFIKIKRVSGTNFEFIYYKKPMDNNITQLINDEIGDWVKNDPSQWFWVQNRWGLKS